MVSTSDLRKGIAIDRDGELWQVLDYHHIKMGRGSAQVRIKLRNVKRGQTVERSFQAGDKWPRAYLDRRQVQFLYRDGSDFHFMDTESYDPFTLSAEQLDDAVNYLKGGMLGARTSYRGETIGVELPITVDMVVTETEPGFAGDTATGARKLATLETGLVVQGPLFVSGGAELPRLVRERLRAAPDLRDVWVEGEIGQVSVSAAGHCYFTLKDERAPLRCVIFRDERQRIAFEPQTGLRVVVHGRIDVFEQQGHYQLYVDALQPAGFGDLALRLEAMKARLAAEGLFDAARKRPLPPWPRVIGLATSETGAVLHDILHVLRRRRPLLRVVFSPCLVPG